MGNILAIIRDPDEAKTFISFVAQFAGALNTPVHLMYIEEEYEYTLGQPPARDTYTGEKQTARVNRFKMIIPGVIKEVLNETGSRVDIDFSADLASVTEKSDEYCRTHNTEMVILEGYVQPSFTGITSNDEIADEIDCPVMIIPRNYSFKPLRKILYASSDPERSTSVLTELIRLFSSNAPEIRIIQIGGTLKAPGLLESLRSRTGYSGLFIDYHGKEKSLSKLVKEYAPTFPDLIVSHKEERNFFEKLFNADPSKKIIEDFRIPLLVYKI
jgi:hypothetical protein